MRTENAHILQDYDVMVSKVVKDNEENKEGNVHILQDFEVMASKVLKVVYDKVVNNREVDCDDDLIGLEALLDNDTLMQKFNPIIALYDGGKGPNVLDVGGQGVLHFVAALDYDWAIPPTIAAWVSVNYRDANGWTALSGLVIWK
ncbi:UNVERIFIED_CONTAM: Calmodulin-binding transcription activator 3, partial [Sesamum angustifolium]